MKKIEKIDLFVKTDVGLKRKRNEDSFLIIDHSSVDIDTEIMGMMFAVADGMGGHPAGDVASRLACEGLRKYYALRAEEPAGLFSNGKRDSRLLKYLKDTVINIDKDIGAYENINKQSSGLGTTLSILVFAGAKALIAHVGDSRIYRMRGERLEQLTVDHTFVGEMVERGELEPVAASASPYRHVLTQALGCGIDEVYLRKEEVMEGDMFLLSSDGLHDMINNEEIKKILQDGSSSENICDKLVSAALDNGGKDNVTVIVLKIERMSRDFSLFGWI